MKTFSRIGITIAGISLLLSLSTNSFGQQIATNPTGINSEEVLPLDPKVEMGILDNGIHYYIRNNKKPENRAELRLIINAGSILEDESQLGLAHFVEHMCFNGTKNFEKNELISYLQSVGVQFGADLNAYTGFDETVYMLSIPTDDEDIVNKAFQILEDWGHQVLFEAEEIDKERGIVLEEWRTGRGADQRMRDQYLPVILNDSRYAERLPIGKKDVLETFKHEDLIRFYKQWYKPELMAIAFVGDLEPQIVKQKIETHFNNIPKNNSRVIRPNYMVPNHDETLISIVNDKEATYSTVSIYALMEVDSLVTIGDYRQSVLIQMYTGMLNQRLRELTQQADPPFIFGSSGYGSLVRTKNTFVLNAYTSDEKILDGMEAVLVEQARAVQYGFTDGELERFKKDYLNYYEKAFNERDKTESSNYIEEYVAHFLEKEATPGIEYELQLVREFLPDISLREINELGEKFDSGKNRAVVITAPEKEGLELPVKSEVLALLNDVNSRKLEPYLDNLAATSLMEEAPTPGKITQQKQLEDINLTELTLSNGAKVILKPTDFKNDEILFSCFSHGGQSLYGDEDYQSAENAARIVNACGLGDFSPTDLQKVLAGKIANASPFIDTYSEGLSGSAVPKDLETLFQLIYLRFTQPRPDQELFDSYINRSKSLYKNLMSNPSYYFSDQSIKVMTQDHPRGGRFPTDEDWEKVRFDRVFDIYEERFANAGDFTFYFVGNFETDSIQSFIETYLGSLPGDGPTETWKDLGIRPPQGVIEKDFFKGSDPKSLVNIRYHGEYTFDREVNYLLQSIAEYLDIRLIEIIREEKSGVYSIGAYSNTSKIPYEQYRISISFPCSPENVDSLVAATNRVMDQLRTDLISEEYIEKIKNSQIRDLEVKLKQNSYWLNALQYYYQNGFDPEEIPNYRIKIDQLSAESILKTAQKHLTGDNRITLVLYPEHQD